MRSFGLEQNVAKPNGHGSLRLTISESEAELQAKP